VGRYSIKIVERLEERHQLCHHWKSKALGSHSKRSANQSIGGSVA